MILSQIIEVLATWIECMIGLLIVAGLVTDSKIKWKRSCIISGIISLAVLVCNQIQFMSFAATIAGIIGIAVGVQILYKTDIRDCLMFSISYILLIYIIDFSSMSIWGSILKNEQFGLHVISEQSAWRISLIIFTKTVLILLYFFVFRKFVINIQLRKRKLWIGVAALSLIVFYLGRLTVRQSDQQSLVVWIFMILILLFGGYCGVLYLQYVQSCRELQFAEERNRMLAGNYERMIHQYRNTQIQNHDIKNHYLVLQELVKKGEFDRAEKYMDVLDADKTNIGGKIRTGISVLDILLEYKQSEAMEEKIYFEVISNQVKLDLTEQEIVALFGNAIDNAIEACKKMKTGVRWIRIVIRKMNEMTFVKITNSIDEIPEMKDKKLLSSKSKEKEYGWGMTSMQLIVNRHGGTIQTSFENHQFTLMLSFFG